MEDIAIFQPAVRIAGTVLRDGTDENLCCPITSAKLTATARKGALQN